MSELQTAANRGSNRLAAAYASRRYAILFYSLLATIAASPLLEASGLDAGVLEIFLAANLLAAVMPAAAGAGRHVLLVALIVVCALRFGGQWLGYPAASTTGLFLWTAIALLAAARAIRFAVRARAVDSEHLYAALDAYLLFGVFLGVFYWTLDRSFPESLVVAAAVDQPISLAAAIYFSFVTLVTLGYGDILPHSEVARGMAVVESVTGQLYLTVMVAHLVSLHVRGAARDGRP